ncbi:MAG: hypothetical protein ACLRFJ_03360 [Alphaproteobacteria bacterium]
MDNKTKLKKAASMVSGATGISALALVATALAPIVGVIQSGKALSNKKKSSGMLTQRDIRNALAFYCEYILAPGKNAIKTVQEMPTSFDKATNPSIPEKTEINDILTLIQNAPSVTRNLKGDIIIGKIKIDPYGTCYNPDGSIWFTFPKSYAFADRIIDAANQRDAHIRANVLDYCTQKVR